MTYEHLRQRVYDILDMTIDEANRLGYSEKIYRITNEALTIIAHAISPYIREYNIIFSNNVLPVKITMPPDFISFFDDQNAYLNGNNFILTEFIGRDGLVLTGKEVAGYRACDKFKYTIYYNALYPKLVEGGKYFQVIAFADNPPLNDDNYEIINISASENRITNKVAFEIPDLIAHLIPHYVVSQLLTQDDKIRSAIEMNEFETLMARLNVDQNERQREYKSSRGWY